MATVTRVTTICDTCGKEIEDGNAVELEVSRTDSKAQPTTLHLHNVEKCIPKVLRATAEAPKKRAPRKSRR